MRIGVFSDDTAGTAVALLVARGLACIGESVDVLVGMPSPRETRLSSGVPGLRIAGASDGNAWAGLSSTRPDGHLVVVLPLDALGEGQPAAFDVVLTAGRDHPASARALRAARYRADACLPPGQAEARRQSPPPWLVPCSHQIDLWTKATLASTGAVGLPFATRAVPFMVPRLGPDGIIHLTKAEAEAPVLRTAVLLASVVSAIATDPYARGVDAASVAALMAGQVPEAGGGTVDRLLALAAEYERLDARVAREGVRRSLPPTDRRRPEPSSPASYPRRRQPDAATRRARHVVH